MQQERYLASSGDMLVMDTKFAMTESSSAGVCLFLFSLLLVSLSSFVETSDFLFILKPEHTQLLHTTPQYHNHKPPFAFFFLFLFFFLLLWCLETRKAKQNKQYQYSVDLVVESLRPLVADGLQTVLLFGVILNSSSKDTSGSIATDVTKSPVILAINEIKQGVVFIAIFHLIGRHHFLLIFQLFQLC